MTGPVTTEALRTALVHACFDPGNVIGPRDGRTMDEWRGDACMKQIAPLLAALQQVTAERDARGEVIANLVDELARLRAEGEAKDRALKPFAGLASSWVVQTAAQRDELLTLSNGERMCGIKATAFINADTALARAATAREG